MIVGFKLLNKKDEEIQSWSGQWGQSPGLPNPIILPNGDHVHCPQLDTDYSGYRLVAWELETIPVEMVLAERSRRLGAGFDFDFNGKIHRIGTTEADMRGWDEVSKLSNALINIGQPGFEINIVTDTGPVTITPMIWQTVLVAAAAFRQPIWAGSFALQALDKIPEDYTNDKYWS